MGNTHGLTKTKEYSAWQSAKTRCYNTRAFQYPHYGARGIVMCERWRESFEAFYADMGPRPSAAHSLDRIDVNGQYSPENCRWATPVEQSNNTRANVFLEFRGERKTVTQWASDLGIPKITLHKRVQSGWSAERALTTPIGRYDRGSIERARRNGIGYFTYKRRIQRGWSAERALTTPV